MTRITYERPMAESRDALIELEGTRTDLLGAFVQIAFTLEQKCGLDIDRLSASLPLMVRLEKMDMNGTVTIDKNRLPRKDGTP